MRFLFRFIPIFLAFTSGGFFVALYRFPAQGLIWLAFFLAAIGYGLFELLGRRIRDRDFWNSFLLLAIAGGGGAGFFLSLEGWFSPLSLALVTTALVGIFSEQLYRWFYSDRSVPSYSMGVSTALLELFSIFFVGATFFGLRIFLRAPLSALAILFALVVGTLYITSRSTTVPARTLLLPAFVTSLLFAELFIVTAWLPTGFMVGGALLALVWYVSGGLLRMVELGLPVRRSFYRYAAVGGTGLGLLVLTARWI